MTSIRHWLEALGLVQYAESFEANDIDSSLLPRLRRLCADYPTIHMDKGPVQEQRPGWDRPDDNGGRVSASGRLGGTSWTHTV